MKTARDVATEFLRVIGEVHWVIVEEFPGELVTADWNGAPVRPYMGDSQLVGTCLETGISGNPACGEPRCEVTHERLKAAARAVSFHCAGAAHRLAARSTQGTGT